MGHPYDDENWFTWREDHLTRRDRKISLQRGLAKAKRKDTLIDIVSVGGAALGAIIIGLGVAKLGLWIFFGR